MAAIEMVLIICCGLGSPGFRGHVKTMDPSGMRSVPSRGNVGSTCQGPVYGSIYRTLPRDGTDLMPLGSMVFTRPVIILEREPCFGVCPVYKLSIFSDGRVIFEGKDHVKVKGSAKTRISSIVLKQLIAEFNRINFFELKDEYVGQTNCPEMFTDAPSAVTSFAWNGRTKTIRHYHGCRGLKELEALTELEGKIDDAVNSRRWIQ